MWEAISFNLMCVLCCALHDQISVFGHFILLSGNFVICAVHAICMQPCLLFSKISVCIENKISLVKNLCLVEFWQPLHMSSGQKCNREKNPFRTLSARICPFVSCSLLEASHNSSLKNKAFKADLYLLLSIHTQDDLPVWCVASVPT